MPHATPVPLRIFILTKNEVANIGRCLAALREAGRNATVLDSGSTDETLLIVSKYSNARLQPYRYIDHCTAYNQITTELTAVNEAAMVLDADMVVTPALLDEVERLLAAGANVVVCPIEMWWEGVPLRYGSLCPPKACAFRGGRTYFEPVGHGERLRADVGKVMRSRNMLVHDDRKGFAVFLTTQVRYGQKQVARIRMGHSRFRDQLNETPLSMFLKPLYSLIVRRGFLSGRIGVVYALDRMIVCAIHYRIAVASRLISGKRKPVVSHHEMCHRPE